MIENLLYTVFAHGLNYLIPFITFPYLVRVLGISEFGLFTFVQNIANYLIAIITFGFHLTGTNEIAQIENAPIKYSLIFHEIFFTRLILLFGCFIILCVALIKIDKLSQTPILYLLAFMAVIGTVFQSEFLFQGMQQMKYLTLANTIARVISLFITFGVVKTHVDTVYAVLGYGLGGLFAGIFCLVVVYFKFNLHWSIPSFVDIKRQFNNGYHVFIASISVILYTSSTNLLILGFVTNSLMVGYYSIADRIFWLSCAIVVPINQAFFPFLSKLSVENYSKYLSIITTLIKYCLFGFGLLALFIYILAPSIISLISGGDNFESVVILRILALCIPLYPLGFIYTNIFLIHQQRKYITILNGSAVAFNLSLIYPMLHFFGLKGLAFNTLIVFIAIGVIGFYIIKTKKIIRPILK